MADNIRVIDCRVDELAANLNMLKDPYAFAAWNWYDTVTERRVTVVLSRLMQAATPLPSGFDLRKIRQN